MIKYIAKLTSNNGNAPIVEVLHTENIAPEAITWEEQAEGVFVGATDQDYFDSSNPVTWHLADYDGKSYSITQIDGAHVEVRGKLPNGDDSSAVITAVLVEIINY